MNRCNCPVCNGRDFDKAGLILAEKEVLPFVKIEILKGSNDKPLAYKYKGLLSSIFAYSQALACDRVHNSKGKIYYTANKWMLQFKDKLNERFTELTIKDVNELGSEQIRQV